MTGHNGGHGKAEMATLSNEKENKRETLLNTCSVVPLAEI